MVIAVITYNRLELTKKCLESIKTHTTGDYKLVVVDNGSTDGTREYLKDYNHIFNDENKYPGAATNQVWSQEDSDYYVRVDNDILFTETGWNEYVIDLFNAFPKVGQIGLLDQRQRLLRQDWESQTKRETNNGLSLNFWWPTVGGPCVVRKEAKIEYIERPWTQLGQNTEDVHFSAKIKQNGWRVANVDKRIALHMSEGNFNDPYYDQTYKEKNHERTLKIRRDETNKYDNYQRVR